MRTTVHVKAAAFDGSFTCGVEEEEWKAFVELLKHLETSIGKDVEASWSNMEDNIEFQFRLSSRGTLEGTYRFSPEGSGLGPTLSGNFQLDQTFLQPWARAAQQALPNAR